MELDEMKLAWQQIDRRLQRQEDLQQRLFMDGKLGKARRGLRPLAWGQVLQLAIGVAFALWGGSFWFEHRQVLHLLICGLLVHACGVLFIIFAARNLYLLGQIDYAAPVLDIQRRLADLRAWRLRVEAPAGTVIACFIWIPVLLTSLAGHGIDLWAYGARGFLYWALGSSAVGLVMVVLVVWLMRWLGYGHVIEASAIGRSVERAEAELQEIDHFGRE